MSIIVDASSNKEMMGRPWLRSTHQPRGVKRELEDGIPRLHSPINSRRFPEMFGDFCKNKTSFL